MESKNMVLHARKGDNKYIFVHPEAEINQVSSYDNLFEFDEADVWSNVNNSNINGAISSFGGKKMVPRRGNNERNINRNNCAASSLPVNIPDWSKVYKVDDDHGSDDGDGNEDNDHEIRVPIHEYLARRRGASFSVHEGIGRTLKGRDLRQVRNAIWKQVGFED